MPVTGQSEPVVGDASDPGRVSTPGKDFGSYSEVARSDPAPDTPLYLPPELWLSIFPYLEDNDLRTVTRTCSAFRLLGQPLLFHVLDICPFFLAYNADRPISRPHRYLQRTLDRLEFYKSPHIAPAVTQLWISPYARSGFPPRRLTDDLDPTLIISSIINALPAFPNVHTLSWHCIDIRPSWWAAIQRLPNLTNLWINSCALLPPPPNTLISPRPLSNLKHLDLDQWAWEGHITNHVSIHEESLRGVDPTLLSMTIRAESIRSISVPRHNTALHLLSVLGKLGYDSSCMLSSLTIPYSSTTSEDFVPTLIQSALLKELHILPPYDEHFDNPDLDPKLPSSAIPHLEIYEGPYHLLSTLSNIRYSKPRRLRFISLWGLDELPAMTVCNPHQLEPILEELSRCETTLNALETFKVLLTHITTELVILLSRFINLQEVVLESQDSLIPARTFPPHSAMELLPESPITVLYVLMREHVFSPLLKHLTLITHLKNTSNLDSATQHMDVAAFMEGLGRVNPQLKSINVIYGTYWTGIVDVSWRRRVPTPPGDNEGKEDDYLSWKATCSLEDGARRAPALTREASSASSVPPVASEISQVAVEKFFALPSKPRNTTTMRLRLGKMTFIEQKRTVVVPERTVRLEEPKGGVLGLSWIAGGVSRAWHFLGRVGRMMGDSVGLS